MKLCLFTGLAVIGYICIVTWGEDERPITAYYSLIPSYASGYMIWKDDSHFVVPDILCYGYDSSYVIALQKPIGPDPLLADGKFRNGREVTYYWAIALRTDSIYGPMTETDYLEFKSTKGISDDLILRRAELK